MIQKLMSAMIFVVLFCGAPAMAMTMNTQEKKVLEECINQDNEEQKLVEFIEKNKDTPQSTDSSLTINNLQEDQSEDKSKKCSLCEVNQRLLETCIQEKSTLVKENKRLQERNDLLQKDFDNLGQRKGELLIQLDIESKKHTEEYTGFKKKLMQMQQRYDSLEKDLKGLPRLCEGSERMSKDSRQIIHCFVAEAIGNVVQKEQASVFNNAKQDLLTVQGKCSTLQHECEDLKTQLQQSDDINEKQKKEISSLKEERVIRFNREKDTETLAEEYRDQVQQDLRRSHRWNVVQGVALGACIITIAALGDEIWGGQYIKRAYLKLRDLCFRRTKKQQENLPEVS